MGINGHSDSIITVSYTHLLTLLQPYLETFFLNYNFNIIPYFSDNFARLFILEFLGAAVINVVASLVAVRKYSNI